jgi:hypothetical protein
MQMQGVKWWVDRELRRMKMKKKKKKRRRQTRP